MFQCVVCGNYVGENHRIFMGLNWCPLCISKDGRILARESLNINPSSRLPNQSYPLKRYQTQREKYLVDRPPYYAIYKNKVPEDIKEQIIKEK